MGNKVLDYSPPQPRRGGCAANKKLRSHLSPRRRGGVGQQIDLFDQHHFLRLRAIALALRAQQPLLLRLRPIGLALRARRLSPPLLRLRAIALALRGLRRGVHWSCKFACFNSSPPRFKTASRQTSSCGQKVSFRVSFVACSIVPPP